MPLTPVPLASQSYQLASRPASAVRTLNLFPEKLPDGSRSPFMLKPTPGLEQVTTLGTGPVLASASIAGSFFAISGDHAWRLLDTEDAAPNDLGYVGTTARENHVTVAIGLTGVVFCVPPRAYVAGFDGSPVKEITTGSGNFPEEGASSVAYIDGYYVFTAYSASYFFLSALLDAENYDSLDFVRPSSQVDFAEHAIAHNGELWLFGQNSVMALYDTGQADGPFQPRTGSVITHGLGAPRSVVQLDGSLWWVGTDSVVWRSNGYKAERVSTHAVEELLQDYESGYLRTITACGFMHEGHSFFAMSLPLLGRTMVYDCATALWSERSSAADGVGRWAINTASVLGSRLLVGSSANGDLYHMKSSVATEAGVAVKRQAVLPMLLTHGQRSFMSRLEVEMEVGTPQAPGAVLLDWSDDGGLAWTAPRSLPTGTLGATRTRVAATRLGSFRTRLLRLTAAAPMTVYGVDVDAQPGTN